MQTIIKSMLAVGLFPCVVISAAQRPNPSRLLFRCLPVFARSLFGNNLHRRMQHRLWFALSSYPRGRAGALPLVFLPRPRCRDSST